MTFVVVGLLALAIAGLLVVFDPRNSGVYPTCPFLGLTGCYCPGCGTLRALSRLLHGDLPGALGFNLVAVVALPFIAYTFATGAMRAFRLRAPRLVFIPSGWIWAIFGGIVAFWVLRNVPVDMLSALAP